MQSDIDHTAIPGDPIGLSQPLDSPTSISRLISDPQAVDSVDGWRRKAPPIEFFSGEDPSILRDDWLPSLERAAAWNGWMTEEKLMQLPGYLKG